MRNIYPEHLLIQIPFAVSLLRLHENLAEIIKEIITHDAQGEVNSAKNKTGIVFTMPLIGPKYPKLGKRW
jgi:hypothetical protein